MGTGVGLIEIEGSNERAARVVRSTRGRGVLGRYPEKVPRSGGGGAGALIGAVIALSFCFAAR